MVQQLLINLFKKEDLLNVDKRLYQKEPHESEDKRKVNDIPRTSFELQEWWKDLQSSSGNFLEDIKISPSDEFIED